MSDRPSIYRVNTGGRLVAENLTMPQATVLYSGFVIAGQDAVLVKDDGLVPEIIAQYEPPKPARERLASIGIAPFSIARYFYARGQIEALEGLHALDGLCSTAAADFAGLVGTDDMGSDWRAFESERIEEIRRSVAARQ